MAEDTKAEKIPSGTVLKRLAKLKFDAKNEMSTISGSLGEQIAKAVEKHNLNKRAFSIASGIYNTLKKDSIKGGRLLRDLELYIDSMDLKSMVSDELPLAEAEDEDQEEPDAKAGPAATMKSAADASQRALDELRAKTGAVPATEGGKPH